MPEEEDQKMPRTAPELETAHLPVGTVLNFAGNLADPAVEKALLNTGWMPCDGRLLSTSDYWSLFAAIGVAHGGESDGSDISRFRLPQLQGRFVRGVNDGAKVDGHDVDPDIELRAAPSPMGNAKDAVGSLQPDATGRPLTAMTLNTTGSHTHSVSHLTSDWHKAYDGASFDVGNVNDGSVSLGASGAHTHSVSGGGDPETRPVNLALFFIIKFR